MKSSINYLMILSLSLLLFSCSKDGDDSLPANHVEYNLKGFGLVHGELNIEGGANKHSLWLYSEPFLVHPNGWEEMIGDAFIMDLYTDASGSLPDGVYTFDAAGSGAQGTYSKGGILVGVDTASTGSFLNIVGGELSVTNTEGGFVLSFAGTGLNEIEISMEYTGALEIK